MLWLEASAPPLESGRISLSFHEPISTIYYPSVDTATQRLLEKDAPIDPQTRKKSRVGHISLARFIMGGSNIAKRSPHRLVMDLPPAFRDISVPVLGTMATDVMRTFNGLIIDPARTRVILVK